MGIPARYTGCSNQPARRSANHAAEIGPRTSAFLPALREVIQGKCRDPLNPGNRKVLVFTAFADTARHLYREVAPWALKELGLHAALVTGAGRNQTTLPNLRKDLGSILTAFSPRSKERPEEFADEGELDLLIATDCISEGQNLQDCDYLINYDIHWPPRLVATGRLCRDHGLGQRRIGHPARNHLLPACRWRNRPESRRTLQRL